MNVNSFTIKAQGMSMIPTLRPNDIVYVAPVNNRKIGIDDIVLVKLKNKFFIHRIIYIKDSKYIITKGDNDIHPDPVITQKKIVGVVYAYKRGTTYFNIREEYQKQKNQYLEEIIKFANYCKTKKIPYIFVKGLPIYLKKIKKYPLRIYADCELFTDSNSMQTISGYFHKKGYTQRSFGSTKVSFIKIFKTNIISFYIQSHFNLFYNQFGLMQRLFPQFNSENFTQELLQNKKEIKYKNTTLFVLTEYYSVLYLLLVFAHYNYKELYRLRLIYEIIISIPQKNLQDFFKSLLHIILTNKLSNLIYPSFILIKKYYNLNIPTKFIKSIRSESYNLMYIQKEILNTEPAKSEFFIKSTLSTLKNLYFLSPVSMYSRIVAFLQINYLYLIKSGVSMLLRKKYG